MGKTEATHNWHLFKGNTICDKCECAMATIEIRKFILKEVQKKQILFFSFLNLAFCFL